MHLRCGVSAGSVKDLKDNPCLQSTNASLPSIQLFPEAPCKTFTVTASQLPYRELTLQQDGLIEISTLESKPGPPSAVKSFKKEGSFSEGTN